jgi:hypothetical protein
MRQGKVSLAAQEPKMATQTFGTGAVVAVALALLV